MVGNIRNGQFTGRVAWRWLWCWLSVMAAGCGQNNTLTPITVSVPPTLLGYTHIPPTLTPMLRVLRTPSLAATVARMATVLTPQPLTLDPPTCHETSVGSLWCFGLVRNTLSAAVESISLRVYLVTADGTALVQGDCLLARQLLRPGDSAPYAVLFNSVPSGIAGAVAVLLSANTSVNSDARLIVLDIGHLRGEVHDESIYHLSGQITNSSAIAIHGVALIATLFDKAGLITGFRQIKIEQTIPPNASIPFEFDVIPQGIGTVRYEVAADGFLN